MAIIVLPQNSPIQLDQSPVVSYLANMGSKVSRDVTRRNLDRMARLMSDGKLDAVAFPWHQLRRTHLNALRAHLAEKYAPSTANAMLSALRSLMKACYELDLMTADDYQKAALVKNIKGSRLPPGRYIPLNEITALVTACRDGSTLGCRDEAIIAVLRACGLRRSELAALDMSDYDSATGQITVLRGKGNKSRIVFITGSAAQSLQRWLDRRGDAPGPLFTWVHAQGTAVPNRGITGETVRLVVQSRAELAKIPNIAPHDFRRTLISDLMDQGIDIATIAKIVGHASVVTTSRYDRRGDKTRRAAAALLDFPD